MTLSDPCPCGSTRPYAACCGPLHDGVRTADSPEELMRSRYSAYARGREGYVWATWHPRTRPDDVRGEPGLRWTGLEVLAAQGDEVEFVATFTTPAGPGRLHERSRFERRGGRWVYVDGDLS